MYGGCICRQLLKPERRWNGGDAPRIKVILDADPHVFFVVGLGPGFFQTASTHDDDHHDDNDDDGNEDDESQQDSSNKGDKDVLLLLLHDANHNKVNDAAVLAISDAIENDDRVVGVFCKLE